jgi:heme/copper-type cytochrome/quinol oxidase subunit 1
MTTIDTHVGASPKSSGSSVVASVGQWVTSSDHKKIGRLFIGWSLVHAIEVAVLGAIFGLERMSPSSMQIFNGDAALQLSWLFRHVLVLGLIAPLFIGIAIAVVPMQVGSKAIAFARLAQYGFWAWLFGSGLVLISIIGNGGPNGGNADMVDLFLLGVGLLIVGLLAASVSVATTILTSRAPGMSLDMIPAFSWSALIGSIATLLSLPVAIGSIIYLYVAHTYAHNAFGGGNGMETWLGWVYSTPQTFVFVIMALGVLAEVAPIAGRIRQPQRPIVLAGLGLISTAIIGAVTQTNTHVLVLSGTTSDKLSSTLLFLLTNGLPLLGVFVTIAVSLLSIKEGRPKVSASFAFAILGSLMILAGVAGSFISNIEKAGLTRTAFGEGITLYLAYGGLLVALGALTHWAPKLWGVVLNDMKVLGLAGLGLIGTVLASLPLYIAGFANQPAHAVNGFDYDGPIALWNVASAAGSALIVLTVLAYVGLLVTAVRAGAGATDDPWDAHTLEWSIPSPAPANNFASLATVSSSEPLLDVKPSQEVSA